MIGSDIGARTTIWCRGMDSRFVKSVAPKFGEENKGGGRRREQAHFLTLVNLILSLDR